MDRSHNTFLGTGIISLKVATRNYTVVVDYKSMPGTKSWLPLLLPLCDTDYMPRKKEESKAQNLGDFALKCNGDKVQQSDKDPPSKHSRNASPNRSCIDSNNQPNADPDASIPLILSEGHGFR
ncbi:hypothetical protein DFH08DRAFT_823500 [Mycena albidolilacea]|uniref:Uncharacterized protein n=1 Tax=Mycena albidolilacea TaxID=1033008 RepID=A0AAD6Z608_9AGAR|nr:hypothetical protein DFH08DRAFT_823500 [Mycena albidolilacea]